MLHVHGCLYRTPSSPADPTGTSWSVSGSTSRASNQSLASSPCDPAGRISPYGAMIGAHVSVSPNASTKASTPNRAMNSGSTENAVGAAYTQRSTLSASSGRGGCFQMKALMRPIMLGTVTWFSRSWSTHRLALNRDLMTTLAPAIRAGYAAMNWAFPWNSGVTVREGSARVSRVSATMIEPNMYICACGIATPFDGPVVPEV